MCLLSAVRKPATKPGNVTSAKSDTAAAAAVSHTDEKELDADVGGKSSPGNSSRPDNKSNSANDAGSGSKKAQHDIKLSSPNK